MVVKCLRNVCALFAFELSGKEQPNVCGKIGCIVDGFEMETPNFVVWVAMVLGIGGFAVGSMVNAYLKPIPAVPFEDEVVDDPSIPLSDLGLQAFVGAVGTYRAGDYRGAIEQFTKVIEEEKGCAEAWHNVGLAYANVGDNNKAVRSFLKASDAYDRQATKEGIDLVKRHLKALSVG